MHDFTINDLLEHRGIGLRHTRLVRHDTRGLAEWRLGAAFFDHYASYQRQDNRTPYNKAKIAIQFVPHSLSGTLFVGAHDILDEWQASDQPDRNPTQFDPRSKYTEQALNHRRYDLHRRLDMGANFPKSAASIFFC